MCLFNEIPHISVQKVRYFAMYDTYNLFVFTYTMICARIPY